MESTLSLAKTAIEGEVGFFLGYGRGEDNSDTAWTAAQTASIQAAVKSGLRQFYYPPPLVEGGSSYDWSFLRPITTLVVPDGQKLIEMPDDFAGLEGRITIVDADTGYPPIDVFNEGHIRELYSRSPTTT